MFVHITMRINLLKLLDLHTDILKTLNSNSFRLKFSNFVTNQLNVNKFLPLQKQKTLRSYKVKQLNYNN